MAKFTKLLAIFLLVNCVSSEAIEDHEFEISESKAYSTAIAMNPNGKNILYMACNEIRPKNKTSSDVKEVGKEKYDQIICDLKLETPSSVPGSYQSSNCHDVQILPKKTELANTIIQLESLQFINDTEIAIKYTHINQWDYQKNQSIFKIFDLSSCTTTADIHFTNKPEVNKIFHYSLIPHNNYLEFLALDHELCKGMRVCSANYSLNGETIGQPKQFPHEFFWFNIYYVDETARQKGYYLIGTKNTNKNDITDVKGMYTYVSYFDSFGKEHELIKQDTTSGFVWYPAVSLSTLYGLFSGCWLVIGSIAERGDYEHKIMQCAQFDTTGMKLNVTSKIENPSFIFATHVLPNHEIILATADLEVDYNNSISRVDSFHIYKIGLNSKMSKPLLVNVTDDVKFRINDKSQISQVLAITQNLNNQSNQFCLRVAYVHPNVNDKEARIKIEDSKYIEKCVSKQLVNNLQYFR